jgi:hypothetical protein
MAGKFLNSPKFATMILYNVTLNVEDEIHDAWLEWMLNEHIPKVIETGLFQSHRMFRLLTRYEEETGTTYSVQYLLKNMADYEIYRTLYAPPLQQETHDKFGEKILAFRTLMEEV